ncbi:DNA-binding transcriptional MerR regulator [Microbacterium endophyticum]|uniref:DNA-binding transcriptional MerR regulator n=1 Tax=Microbacterium endophyticum TaxID=1526412 RepID=A0A7W4V3G7_9MICO|nr:MerR family transcriptional regulator [Microbacterium endophyticum]MBB2976198.1 DNA-binding transcriptional MerR regulator [Microbacterium endophyticum]NIK36495.1 DNA-binding transcriptional MerR regulator [Microbacterium endophyticum]
MAAASAHGRAASGGVLSIGQVLARLSPEFPGLSASKLRFLEEQGIVTPQRTESGYRKFSARDVDRLRLALTLQRDHFRPLAMIRDYLEQLDAGRTPALPAAAPPSIAPVVRRYRRDELLSASGAAPQLFNEAISMGLLTGAENYTEQDVALLRSLVALERHGIEPRHLRGLRQSAERDVSLIESALTPLLRRTDSSSRSRAADVAPELARRLDDVRSAIVRSGVTRLTS